MAQFTYRLQRLLEQKEDQRKQAENELARREEELETQLRELQSLQQRERELVERRERLRRELLEPSADHALTAEEVKMRSDDIKAIGVHINDARNDVLSQGSVVEQCQVQIEQQKRHVEEARRELEILTKHRAKQEERFHRALEIQEELALDEIGNALHATRRREL